MTPSVLSEVYRKLGGQPVLGSDIRSQADLAAVVQARLPLSALRGLSRAGLTDGEIDSLIIAPRTRRHRAGKRQPLTVDESDRAVRLLRIQSLAEEVFDDVGKAAMWLRKSLAVLDGATPLQLSQTEAGARVVEDILGKIAWGAAA